MLMALRNGIRGYLTGTGTVGAVSGESPRMRATDVSVLSRASARLFAARYDQQIESGVAVVAGTPLAAHYARVAARRERQDMAEALTQLLREAGRRLPGGGRANMRVPIRTDAVQQSAEVVEDVLVRLLGPLPIRARGMARLRTLLSDGRGPVYRSGQGTFAAAMPGVLAAM